MDGTTPDSNKSSWGRPEVIVAIVFGCIFGVLLVLVSIVAYIFIKKYQNLKRAIDEQGDQTHHNNRDVARNEPRDNSTHPTLVSQTAKEYSEITAIQNNKNENREEMKSRTFKEPYIKTQSAIGDKLESSQIEHQLNGHGEQIDTGTLNPTFSLDDKVENNDTTRAMKETDKTTSTSRKTFWHNRHDRNLANSEKIGQSKKRYIERLFRRVTKRVPEENTSVGKHDAAEHVWIDDNKTDLHDSRENIENHLTCDLHDYHTKVSDDLVDLPEEESGFNTHTVIPRVNDGARGDDYLQRMLEQLRKEEMGKERDDMLTMRRCSSHRVKVDDEMLKFHEMSMNYLSQDKPERSSWNPSRQHFKSLAKSEKRRLDRLHSDNYNIEEED